MVGLLLGLSEIRDDIKNFSSQRALGNEDSGQSTLDLVILKHGQKPQLKTKTSLSTGTHTRMLEVPKVEGQRCTDQTTLMRPPQDLTIHYVTSLKRSQQLCM